MLIKTQRKGLKTSNLAYTMLVQGRTSPKMRLSLCLLALLGSKGIVVKCTGALYYVLLAKKKSGKAKITLESLGAGIAKNYA